jgi:starch-binding outer membrane protein, SusD/RagB family
MSLFSNPIRTARRGALLLVPLSLMIGCTDLSENPPSLITKDTFYKNADEVNAGVASVYANMKQTLESYYAYNQVSSDETVVPVRGSDWLDNGAWLELHRQGWGPTSVVGLREGNAIWNNFYTGIARANIVLEALETVDVAGEARTRAELRALRAYHYMVLNDIYGGVPITTTTKVENRPRNTRLEVFNFIETELKAARTDLPVSYGASEWGRVTRGAADAMLASLYLNAQVWGGSVTTAGLQAGPARWADAIASADAVLNNTAYSLNANLKDAFKPGNQLNAENILVLRYSNIDQLGLDRQFQSAHYNTIATGDGGWNGFSVVADSYNKFDADDIRRTQILAGPQNSVFTGAPVFERGNPTVRLNFTVNINNIEAAAENEGVRIYKYPFDPARANGRYSNNDFVLYRLAEMMLIKAEAQNELGQTAAAITILNQLRARAFSPFTAAKQIPATTTQAALRTLIQNERLFELIGEGKRRQDQIRAGTFISGAWFGKPAGTAAYKILMSIPQAQINVNPLLTQNPGY